MKQQQQQHLYDAIEVSKILSQIERIDCPKNRAMMKDFLLEVSYKEKETIIRLIGLRYCDVLDLAKAVNSDGHLNAPFMVHDNLESSEAQSFWYDIRWHWPDGQWLYKVVSKGTPFETE